MTNMLFLLFVVFVSAYNPRLSGAAHLLHNKPWEKPFTKLISKFKVPKGPSQGKPGTNFEFLFPSFIYIQSGEDREHLQTPIEWDYDGKGWSAYSRWITQSGKEQKSDVISVSPGEEVVSNITRIGDHKFYWSIVGEKGVVVDLTLERSQFNNITTSIFGIYNTVDTEDCTTFPQEDLEYYDISIWDEDGELVWSGLRWQHEISSPCVVNILSHQDRKVIFQFQQQEQVDVASFDWFHTVPFDQNTFRYMHLVPTIVSI